MRLLEGWASKLGGVVGSIGAYLLNISLAQIIEIALYAFIGSAIGEGVKEAVKYYKKKNGQ